MSDLNHQYDSRIVRVSVGAAGMTRPDASKMRAAGLDQVFCLSCGKSGGAVTSEIPVALRGDPGVIYICPECDAKSGPLPLEAISFERYKE